MNSSSKVHILLTLNLAVHINSNHSALMQACQIHACRSELTEYYIMLYWTIFKHAPLKI
jgi:hypothetical protein